MMRKKTKTEHVSTQPQTVDAATATLAALEQKRSELQAQAEELATAKKAAAFSAHTGDGEHRLASVTRAIRENASDLESLSEAIHEGRNRLAVAQVREQQAAAEANAGKVLELARKLREAGEKMNDACRTLGETGKELGDLLLELRSLGVAHPTLEMWLVHGNAALQTAILNTPWARDFRPLPPDRRRQFGPLVSGWATAIESRVRIPKREEIAA